MSITEHTWAMRFFTEYSNDVHEYRMHLLSPTGIPVMVQNIKSQHADIENTDRTKQDIQDLCLVFARVATFDWYLPILVQCDICPTIVSLLMYVALSIYLQSSLILVSHFLAALASIISTRSGLG
jgi:hypothetical protein